jgi:hypothetical protein
MATRGDVSLDVEDNRSPYDWPQIDDMTLDMLKYSLHFPLVPQKGTWPDGEKEVASKQQTFLGKSEVARVLNIVVPESRLLSSRERCPFLVHLEVADSGLDGSDARLYASGVTGLGSTVEEALGMVASAASTAATRRFQSSHFSSPSYGIPLELSEPPCVQQPVEFREPELSKQSRMQPQAESREFGASEVPQVGQGAEANGPGMEAHSYVEQKEGTFPRGGWQADQSYVYEESTGFIYHNPHDFVRQQEYERLHQQMHWQSLAPSTPAIER